jgi:FKBP-type peptidyl-prolyl cis-trans isomerase
MRAIALLLALALVTACARTPDALPAPRDVAAPPAGSLKTPSGLSTLVLQKGTGSRHPRPTDRVTVHYSGWTTDGRMFDSSVTSGQPATFALNGVIDGWTEGVQMMVVGEKRRFWIPESLAYKGLSDPRGMLVFDIELLRIE